MKFITTLMLFTVVMVQAQTENRFYATMALQDAKELQQDIPNEIEILKEFRNEAAVYMTNHASHLLHDRVLVHGPGYIRKTSASDAISSISYIPTNTSSRLVAFNITEDVIVNETLPLINTQNIEDHILELEAYGNRYHANPEGSQSANDLKTKWEAMAASYGRTDVSVRLFNHTGTNMPSVIMTIEGAEIPEEFVVVGGHLDSTSNQGNNNAPGADDDASGIATITEATRALFEVGFVPKRTIEVMAYAAEEIGLVGSAEIAAQYDNNNVNVIAVGQFDMTLYNGSANDVGFITDFTSGEITAFMMSLIDHYNNGGAHPITYGVSQCNYGCSDHASWTSRGYLSAFPFEANFGQHNGQIHSPNDTFSLTGTAEHSAKFAKLCAEFLIEASKSEGSLGVSTIEANNIQVQVNNGALSYDLSASASSFKTLSVYDIQGKLAMQTNITNTKGVVNIQKMQTGVYVVTFETTNGQSVSKKVVVQ
ncbi:MAG: M20/M25/M40 family metallo-hydrolase [Bacteroidetes bacterium]|nr:M20/M25/M40 family metallo-hydrolase [Bacteroidota bacterium]